MGKRRFVMEMERMSGRDGLEDELEIGRPIFSASRVNDETVNGGTVNGGTEPSVTRRTPDHT
ncbi:MAG: hypothetical protein M1134_07680 [Actinobacteria bacterium]|nr:hypothetical protein [Actinomycetota bacterium]MCL5444848.1 hypothetical protein [Actinomycetota bacterium]